MKNKWKYDLACAIIWLIAAVIWLYRCFTGDYGDMGPAWTWTTAICEVVCFTLWSVVSYKNYKRYNKK